MPIYEYRCNSCGKRFEIMQSINAEPLRVCESCNGQLQKIISQCTFHLKGSGWYLTDYARKENKVDKKEDTKDVKKDEVKETPKELKEKEGSSSIKKES